MEISGEVLKKHAVGICAARNYWILNKPTGLSDSEFDRLEREARADGLELRDWVCQEIQGTRTQNAEYIRKVPKTQVPGDMWTAVGQFTQDYRTQTGQDLVWIPKYDGSSLAAYYDTQTGRCVRVVTVGGSNLGAPGIDQTKKFARYFPALPGTGICAVQAECLVALEHGFAESSRQKANGLVNSKYMESEVDSYCGIRAFRYFLDPNHPGSQGTLACPYQTVMASLPIVTNMAGDIKFCGGYVMTPEQLASLGPDIVNKDVWKTPSGTFLVDGLVAYTPQGECIQALKYKSAGRGESTKVLDIKWNDQSARGKDSWSANAIITPVTVRGSVISKPTVGSVKKMVTTGLSKGARVTVILANSTIPQVSDVIEPGNGDFQWPTCGCGWKMSEADIFGSLLKCGNPECSERFTRMSAYLSCCPSWSDIDLGRLLVIDRLKWEDKVQDLEALLKELKTIVLEPAGTKESLYGLLEPVMSTELQKRNLALVVGPAWRALRDYGSRIS